MPKPPVLPAKLPNKRLNPYTHPIPEPVKKKATAMTIGIGFKFKDGFILGADQQMTSQGSHKFHEPKLFYEFKNDRSLALIGAGDLSLAKEVWDKLRGFPVDPIPDAIKVALEAILDNMGRTLPGSLDVQLLVGVATPTSADLFSFYDKGITSVSEFMVLAAGDSSLIHYLKERLHHPWMEQKEGFILASYLLKRAEDYIDGCSGPMDVVSISPGPRLAILGDPNVRHINAQIKAKENATLRDLLSDVLPFSISP